MSLVFCANAIVFPDCIQGLILFITDKFHESFSFSRFAD